MDKLQTKEIKIPEQIKYDWQKILDLLTTFTHVPTALIMQINQDNMVVFSSSSNLENPYNEGDKEPLEQGLYCEYVIKHREKLVVPNALNDPKWKENPDIALDMISYCGLPLYWPDNTPFGTICILDTKENHYNSTYQELLTSYQKSIEAQLRTLYLHEELQLHHRQLKQQVIEKTKYIQEINKKLEKEIDCRCAAEQKALFNQHHDSGTHFLNAGAIEQYVNNLLTQNTPFALFHIYFANGDTIQYEHGQEAFDQLLVKYHSKLTQFTDTTIIGRLSRNDILLIVHTDKNKLSELCQHLTEVGLSSYSINKQNSELNTKTQPILFHTYIGAIYSTTGKSYSHLLQKTQDAVLEAKNTGKTFLISTDQKTNSNALSTHQIESYLLDAVRNQNIHMHYQPKVCPISKRWLGSEALLRWNHPKLGSISNEILIPLAESNGLIYDLGNFALRTAIQQTSEWVRDFPFITTAVNLSAIQLKSPNLAQHIQHLLALYQLDPKHLELEVTESSLIINESLASKTLTELHNLGISIALDDFGTGYASFNYLKKYPFDILKIDRHFLHSITNDRNNQEIVKTMVNIANKLKLSVIVEGVEDKDQEAFILKEKIGLAQGYLYARPMSATRFENELFNQSILN